MPGFKNSIRNQNFDCNYMDFGSAVTAIVTIFVRNFLQYQRSQQNFNCYRNLKPWYSFAMTNLLNRVKQPENQTKKFEGLNG